MKFNVNKIIQDWDLCGLINEVQCEEDHLCPHPCLFVLQPASLSVQPAEEKGHS